MLFKTVSVVFLVVDFIWVVFILPIYVERKIISYVHVISGEIRNLELISRKESLYLVKYSINDTLITELVYYDFFGKITRKEK